MEKIERFFKFINIILIVVALFLEGKILHKLEESGIHNFWVLFLVVSVILIFIVKMLELGIEKLVEHNQFLKIIIIGDEYIEGIWFDVLEIEGSKFYGLFTLSFKEGQFRINGTQYNEIGKPQSSWKTISSNFSDFSLRTIYQTTYFEETKIEEPYGISIYNFSQTASKKRPLLFSGSFYDMSAVNFNKSFYGFKVTDKEILKMLNDPASIPEAILSLSNSPYVK